ncbi:tetratricopeptide repeat protein [Atopococcus tabaci]|uniref:tetratricopeptide repeat protein n=1 Tax=Atopococcus tabaci TaxID=269774 RepID=UPI0004295D4E|nr:tetratricopeptide repeat protein [Atopococcus tabaci]
MGDKIEFPKNYERFLLKGTELMNNGNVHEAVTYFEKAYDCKKEKVSNTLFVTALYETGQYQEAVDVAEEMIAAYEGNEYRYIFYVTLLIKAKRILQAEAIIKKQLEVHGSFRDQWLKLAQTLDAEKEKMNQEVKAYEQTLLKKMYAVGDLSLEEQLLLMEEVKKLPDRLQENGCRAVLQNPFATEITKTAALHYLKELGLTEEVEFLWFNERRSIRPVDLYDWEEHPVTIGVQARLKNATEKNPSLSALILQEAQLHLMQLYPYLGEVITDPGKWSDLYLTQYGEKAMPETQTTEEETMLGWFRKLSQQVH